MRAMKILQELPLVQRARQLDDDVLLEESLIAHARGVSLVEAARLIEVALGIEGGAADA